MADGQHFKPINQHASHLAQLLYRWQGEPFGAWYQAAQWFEVASTVQAVTCEVGHHDLVMSECEASMDYDDRRAAALGKFVPHLVRFQMCWAGLEAVISIIDPPELPKPNRGKINAACAYLREHFGDDGGIARLEKAVEEFVTCAREEPFRGEVESRLLPVPHVGLSGRGLRAVYGVRNCFAHGDAGVSFPEPDEDDTEAFDQLETTCGQRTSNTVRTATRLVLITTQMLIMAHVGRDVRIDDWSDSFGSNGGEKSNLYDVLSRWHLTRTRPRSWRIGHGTAAR